MAAPNNNSPIESLSLARRRRWHPRVFTGCVQCRRRHVKCDGGLPSCANCTRRSLGCDNPPGVVFKVLGPRNYQPGEATSASSADRVPADEWPTPTDPDVDGQEEECPAGTDLTGTDTASEDLGLALSNTRHARDSQPPEVVVNDLYSGSSPSLYFSTPAPSPAPVIRIPEQLYYGHFITTVSKFLIVYDTPSNSNPFRMLPQLPGASELLRDTMIALGALHLSSMPGTQDTQLHIQAALKMYSTVVSRLRSIAFPAQPETNLSNFAISLLLCVFEMMFSTNNSWKIHLAGAHQAFKAIYSPREGLPASADGGQSDLGKSIQVPMRRFLVSLMSYLDVAASCATGEGTLVHGDYWELYAGSWEYNLGAPSFNPSQEPADRVLAQIRHSWSKLMSIQVGISSFATSQRTGCGDSQRTIQYDALSHRMWNWHNAAPSIFNRLAKLDRMPPNATKRDNEILTAAACVESYARACAIHLNRVATQKLGNASDDPEVALAVDKVLHLTSNFSSGIHRIALLWPMFMAGAATRDHTRKTLVHDYFVGIKSFGFKNAGRALDILEYVWLQQRLFGEADYTTFDNLTSANLLP